MTAERTLLHACRIGEIAVISEQRPEQATDENTVRAGFLRFLLLGGDHSTPVHERGVRLMGAWVTGVLDLENTATVSAIDCAACTFIDPLILRRSTVPGGLFLMRSTVPGIQGDGLVTTGDVLLRDGLRATGEVRLLDAQIGGSLECSKGQFDGKEGHALSADRAVIKGSVFLRDGFQATGTVRLLGAQIGGNLTCSKGQFDGEEGYALSADSAVIKGSVFLRNGFRAMGEVRLMGAQIGGNLECSKGQFDGKESHALGADRAVIKGNVFLRDGFQATSEVRLLGVQIGGDLDCSKGQFDGNGGDALSVDRAVIEGNVFLGDGFKVTGKVRLPGVQIGGNLECDAGQFDGKGGNALSADGAVIKGSVFLRDGFQAMGEVRLLGVQIGGNLDCSKTQFDGKGGDALCAEGMRVTGGFLFRDLASPVNRVSLASASVGVLADDAEAWGGDLVLDGFTYGSIGGGAPTSAAARLAWLDKQRPGMSGQSGTGADFRPQPWKELQKVLREMGHAEDARQVAVALEHRLRKAGLIGQSPETLRYWPVWTNRPRRWMYRRLACGFHWGFWALTGYGYRPMRLMVWMLAAWLSCAAFYWFAALPPNDVFAPSNPLVFQHADYQVCAPNRPASDEEMAKPPKQQKVVGAGNWYLCSELREEYTGFSPLAYSLDVILPLVDLQQQKDWGPLIPTPKASWWRELLTPSWKHATRLVIWFETLFGWLASLLLVAIVSGLTKRRED